MVSRGELKDSLYEYLVSNATGTYDVTDATGNVVDTVTVADDDVELISPGEEETLPTVMYDVTYRPVSYNGAGRGPESRTYDNNGNLVSEVWKTYEEADVSVFVRADGEATKEPIFRAVYDAFDRLGRGPWYVSDIHDDVIDVSVGNTDSADSGDVDEVIRGDQLQIFITFYRTYELDTDKIQTIGLDIDGEGFTTT